jgi:hypothetical protein
MGGLISFGPVVREHAKADYVDKILRGAKPAYLPSAAVHLAIKLLPVLDQNFRNARAR